MPAQQSAEPSTNSGHAGNSAPAVLGRIEPRIWTPPLRPLTPETSYGYDVIQFAADVLCHPLDPWQEWAIVHAGELLDDGRPRFRTVLLMVSRQNGKTELPVVLSLYWQFVEAVALVLGTSTKLDYAKESWTKATRLAELAPALDGLRPRRWKRQANGEQESWTSEGSRYKIAASNSEGGRSLTVHRLILDELRQHHDYTAWDAAVPATAAVWDAQIWALSNAGDDRSVVLNELRDQAVAYVEWWDTESGRRGVAELLADPAAPGDWRTGLFEWSSPAGSSPLDIDALAQANPALGRRIDPDALLSAARRAMAKGGEALTGFKTEHMCQRVKHLNPAIDPAAYADCLDPAPIDDRSRVALCLDVAPDQHHATLYAAVLLDDGRTRVDYVDAWSGDMCTEELRRELPDIVARVRPAVLGWFPNGPAAALAAELASRGDRPTRRASGLPGTWPPAGVRIEPIKSDTPSVCMGFASLVDGRRLARGGDPLLDAQVDAVEKLERGDVWVFSRRGGGHCDAVYAAAGAAHIARTMPPPVGKPRLILDDDDDDGGALVDDDDVDLLV